jgi:hypothetical protein
MRHSTTSEASWLHELQHSGSYFAMLPRMGATHRLVLRWCAYLPFEDVLRIGRKWLFGREPRGGRCRRWQSPRPGATGSNFNGQIRAAATSVPLPGATQPPLPSAGGGTLNRLG